MTEPIPSDKRRLPMIHLLPNLLTIIAICAGLTAIRSAVQGEFEKAVTLILLACVLDGVDGRLARLIRGQSLVGAELDSLADFVNFGVAPGLILYFWGMQDLPRAGWVAVLVYAICCVLRLARFNVSSRSETEKADPKYFIGVPSPAGAGLVMLPMFIAFAARDWPVAAPEAVALYTIAIGFLMIARVPTYSFKNLSLPREKARYALVGMVLLIAALVTYLWITLAALSLIYIAGVMWAMWGTYRQR
jgi:CDP-diacylglycerol--serine O-phosphatidyltransferase